MCKLCVQALIQHRAVWKGKARALSGVQTQSHLRVRGHDHARMGHLAEASSLQSE